MQGARAKHGQAAHAAKSALRNKNALCRFLGGKARLVSPEERSCAKRSRQWEAMAPALPSRGRASHRQGRGMRNMEKPIILAIAGSLRKGSYNRQLAVEAGKCLGERATYEILDYSSVPLFSQDIETPVPDAVREAKEKAAFADAVWFFTPEYNHYFPGVLKNLLDWLSRPERPGASHCLLGKMATISGATPGMSGTVTAQDHLAALLTILGMRVYATIRLSIPHVLEQTDETGALNLKASVPFLEKQAISLLYLLNKELNGPTKAKAKTLKRSI
jgi:chromate reductase